MFHHLPTEVVDQIIRHACRMPVTPPNTYGTYAALTGAGDIDTTTNLMCVCRHFYNVIAPLLYRAPLLVYTWQVTALHRTLKHHPSLALLIEHLFMYFTPMLKLSPEYPFAPNDYEAMFHVAPRGTTFPLHYAIEYDVAEYSAALSTISYPPQPERVHFVFDFEPATAYDSIRYLREIRHILAWLRCAAAYGARNAVSPSEIPRLEVRGREVAERLKNENLAATNFEITGSDYCVPTTYDERIARITARLGTRFKEADLLLPDLSVEMPALNALQLEEYDKLEPVPTDSLWEFLPSIRLAAARALAYGRLNGAGNERAYAAYLNEDHRGTWRNRDEESEPWTAEYRDVPDEEFYDTPLGTSLSRWYSSMPGTRLSPAPCCGLSNLAEREIVSMSTRLRTLACRTTECFMSGQPVLLPEKLITRFLKTSDPAVSPMPVRELVWHYRPSYIADLRYLLPRDKALANVDRCTLVTNNGLIRLDRTVLDAFASTHENESLANVSGIVNRSHPLISEFGAEPTFTHADHKIIDTLLSPRCFRAEAMLYYEWLRAAADPPLPSQIHASPYTPSQQT